MCQTASFDWTLLSVPPNTEIALVCVHVNAQIQHDETSACRILTFTFLHISRTNIHCRLNFPLRIKLHKRIKMLQK